MLGRRAEVGGDQQGPELVAVRRDRTRLVINPRPPGMGGGRVIQEFFFDRVLAEPGNRARPPGDRGAGSAPGLEFSSFPCRRGGPQTAAGHDCGTS